MRLSGQTVSATLFPDPSTIGDGVGDGVGRPWQAQGDGDGVSYRNRQGDALGDVLRRPQGAHKAQGDGDAATI